MRPKPTDNCDISRAENAAQLESFGTRALTVALQQEPGFLKQAQELSRIHNPRRHRAQLRKLARRYAPRGPDKRQLIETLLSTVATAIQHGLAAGLPPDTAGDLARARLQGFGKIAYASDELRPGDPQRRPKAGNAHDIRETIWRGAQMIARRGAGGCINLDCQSSAWIGPYCGHCHHDLKIRDDHNRRLKDIQATWDSALPHVLGTSSKPRARRLARAS